MNRKPNLVRKLIGVTVSLLFLVYLYVNRHSIIDSLEGVKPALFGVVVIGQILAQAANALILRSSLQPLGVRLGYYESFRVTTVSSFINFFTPVVGGASAKAVYFKSRHGLSYPSFAGALYANYVIMFLVSFILGLAGVFVIPNALESSVGGVLAFFLACGVAGSAFFVLAGHKMTALLHRVPSGNRFVRGFLAKVKLVEDGWASIKNDRHAVAHLFLWSACLAASLILIYWASIASIGLSTSFGSYMIFAALASVSLLLNLTPGSIGVRETLYAGTYAVTGISAPQVVAFSVVDRAAQLVVIGSAWIIFGNSVLKDAGKDPR